MKCTCISTWECFTKQNSASVIRKGWQVCSQRVLMRLSITAVSGFRRKGEQSRLGFLLRGLLLVPINTVIKSADASLQTFVQRKANERKEMPLHSDHTRKV